jgi:hypothetical protein
MDAVGVVRSLSAAKSRGNRTRRGTTAPQKEYAAVVFRRKTKNAYEYMLQHRHPGIWGGDPLKGADMLGLPGGAREMMDRGALETAWREAREESALPDAVTLTEFMRAVVTVFWVSGHNTIAVVDADALESWWHETTSGTAFDKKADEVSTAVFPSGHVWVSEQQLDALLLRDNDYDAQVLGGVRIWPAVAQTLREFRPALGFLTGLVLYHGTTVDRAQSILREGFRVQTRCTGACKAKPCQCGMLGYGVYLAAEDKSSSNAGRAANSAGARDPESKQLVGAVLECRVDVGKCEVLSTSKTCSCPCGRVGGVDHSGSWQRRGLDSVYLPGGGPAAKRAEWCVADARRVTPVRMRLVYWSDDRCLLATGEWL